MLRYACYHGMLDLKTPFYSAKKDAKNNFIYIRTSDIDNILDLHLDLALDNASITLQEPDELHDNGPHSADALKLSFHTPCGQILHLDFYEQRIESYVSNVGNTRLVKFFNGSRLNCNLVFNPFTGTFPEHYFNLREPQNTLPSFLSPPPWFLAFRQFNGKWASTALEPLPGQLDFLDLETCPDTNGNMAWLVNMGIPPKEYTQERHTPPLVFRFNANDEFDALKTHADWVADCGKAQRPIRHIEDWQRGILACGWRFQCNIPRQAECTQTNYQAFVDMLDDNHIPFDTLIVDDFWGRQHGLWEVAPEKWPDMRGFIDKLHARGKHFLLWICTAPTGLPAEESIGLSVNANSEAYKKRVQQSMRYLLSDEPDCLNADGFKYDFTSQLPEEYPNGSLRNMAFMYERFKIITDAARAIKPNCLLDYQCANPYFAHLQNMLRINDYFGLPETAFSEMVIRCKIAKIASYGALIDTDHNSYNRFPYDYGESYFNDIQAYGCTSLYLMPSDLKNKKLLANLQNLRA